MAASLINELPLIPPDQRRVAEINFRISLTRLHRTLLDLFCTSSKKLSPETARRPFAEPSRHPIVRLLSTYPCLSPLIWASVRVAVGSTAAAGRVQTSRERGTRIPVPGAAVARPQFDGRWGARGRNRRTAARHFDKRTPASLSRGRAHRNTRPDLRQEAPGARPLAVRTGA